MKVNRIMVVICAVIFLFSIYKVTNYVYASHENKQVNDFFREEYAEKQIGTEVETTRDQTQQAKTESSKQHTEVPKDFAMAETLLPQVMERFLPLLELNEEIIGWIGVANTEVNYPIVKTEDNEFYLDHNVQRNRSGAGSIFMDFRNQGDGTDRNTILYGHNMRDGSMFHGLMNYKDRSFFEGNPTITVHTLYEETEWEIFSAYVTDTSFDYIATKFRSNHDYVDFLETLLEKSMYDHEVELTKDDKILTLSTCTYEFGDARFVIHAKRIK